MAVTIPAGILLASADDWTRDILLDVHNNTHPASGLLAGWADVMRAADVAWQAIPAHATTGSPFEHAVFTAARILNDQPEPAGRADPRTRRIVGLLDSLADTMARQPAGTATDQPGHDVLRTGILHVGYVLTHAATLSTARRATAETDPGWRTHQRIRGIEQLLDAHLHGDPRHGVPTGAVIEVDQALTRWLHAACNAGQPPNPMSQLIVADTTRTLLGNTARLVIHTFQRQQQARLDAQDRLLPAIRDAVEAWEDTRSIWTALITPTTRQLPELMDAATRLHSALRQPELIGDPAIRSTITSALVVAAEVAIVNKQVLIDPELTAPRRTITSLIKDMVEREPSRDSVYETWQATSRLEANTPAELPAIVRTDLTTRGEATLQATLAARSAGHILTQAGTRGNDATLHTARGAWRTPKSAHRTTPTRTDRRPPGISR